jgi:hypothetical protein
VNDNASYVGICYYNDGVKLSEGTNGDSFTQLDVSSAYSYTSIAISGDTGQYIALAAFQSAAVGIMVSSDYGQSFEMSNAPYSSYGPVVSASGQYMAAISSNYIVLSTTYGASWFLASSYGTVRGLDISGNGAFIYAVYTNVYIISMDVPGGPTAGPTAAPSVTLAPVASHSPVYLPTSFPTSAIPTSSSQNNGASGESAGTTAGIIVGVLVFVVAVAGGVYYYIYFTQKLLASAASTVNGGPSSLNDGDNSAGNSAEMTNVASVDNPIHVSTPAP